MIKEKDSIFADPNREEREFIAGVVNNLNEKVYPNRKGRKKKKEIFLKKLVSLKRSCTFAAAYRDSH